MNPRPLRPIIFAALAIAVAAHGLTRPAAAACPGGYAWGETHVYGQAFEAGFPPRGDTPVVIVQHEDRGLTGTTYIVQLGCLREQNAAERAAINAGLSTGPSNWPVKP